MKRNILSLSILCLIILCATGCSQKKSTDGTASQTYTEEQSRSFWNEEISDLIEGQLITGELPYPELNERYSDSLRLIMERTGKPLHFSMSTMYHWMDKRVEASAGMIDSNNTAVIQFYVPSLYDSFVAMKSKSVANFREAYRAHVLIVTMHELEHLRIDKPKPQHVDINEESRCWAETCKYVIDPLVRTHGVRLASDLNYYTAWLESGGDTDHPIWQRMMRDMYGSFHMMNEKAVQRE